MKTPKYLLIVGLVCMSLTLGSCGNKSPNSFIRDVSWESTLVEDDLWLKFSTQFNLGALTFTSVQLPIYNPQNPSEMFGAVTFRPTLDGYSEVETSVNLSACTDVSAGVASLPNGRELPIAGLSTVKMYQLNIDSIHSRMYLGLNNSTMLFGFAISIQEFDQLSKSVGGMLNFFPGFQIKGLRGMLGFYTGVESFTSGLAFFVDLSQLFSPDILNALINGKSPRLVSARSASMIENVSTIGFAKGTPKLNDRTIKALKTLSNMSNSNESVILTPVQD